MWWTFPFLTCLGVGQRTGDPRPDLSGPEQVELSSDGRFALHYTLEGRDAVAGGVGSDGVPELVVEALDALAFGEVAFLERGYRPLIPDGGDGGSTAIDVYLKDIDANGYAHPLTGGEDGASCFMQLDSKLTLPGLMRSVAIHELHHCVEYRYTAGTQSWIYEATATFEQYLAFSQPTLEAAVLVLWQRRLQAPDQPMAFTDGDFEYAGMVPMLFWEQYGGFDPDRLPNLWEALAVDPGWRVAFDTEAQRVWGRPWAELFLEYATWNAFACAHDDGAHYDDSQLACNDVVSVPIEALAWDGEAAQLKIRLLETDFTAAYFEIPDDYPDRDLQLDCVLPRERAVLLNQLVAVGSDGASGEAVWGSAAEALVLPAGRSPGGSVRLVAASVGEAPVNASCRLVALKADSEGAAGCACDGSRGPLAPWLALSGLALLARGRRLPTGALPLDHPPRVLGR